MSDGDDRVAGNAVSFLFFNQDVSVSIQKLLNNAQISVNVNSDEISSGQSFDGVGGAELLGLNASKEFVGEKSALNSVSFNNGDNISSLVKDLESFLDSQLVVIRLDGGEVEFSSLLAVELAFLVNVDVGRKETLIDHPVVAQELVDVVSDGVRQYNNNSVVLVQVVLQSVVNDGADSRSGRTTDQETFFSDESSGHGEGFFIVSLDPFINVLTNAGVGDEIVTDTFNVVRSLDLVEFFGLGQDGTVGVDTDALASGDLFLDLGSATSHGTTSSQTSKEVVELSAGLVNNFLTSVIVMSNGVTGVVVLIEDDGVFQRVSGSLGDFNVRFRGVPGSFSGGSDNLSSQTLHNIDLFLGHLFGKSDNHVVSLDGSSHAKTNTGISGSGFDEGVSGLDEVKLFSIFNHSLTNTILNGTTGVKVFTLHEDFALKTVGLGDVVQTNQRSVSDDFSDVVENSSISFVLLVEEFSVDVVVGGIQPVSLRGHDESAYPCPT